MSGISTKNTVLGVVVEVTEGTPVAPTSASMYCTVQEDLSFKPDFNVLKNNEVVASIGQRQSILGSEKPTVSFSHYLKHSGVEGQAPEWSNILKAAFGTKTTIASQEVTSGSSAVGTLNITAGHGVNVSRGQGVLIKDATNGYRIRVVDSISTDALALGFNVPVAPATATGLGKPVFFSPAQSGHISLSLWRFLGGQAVEMVAGARPTSISIKASAGDLVNCSLQFSGIGYYMNPVEITSSTRYIDWTDDGGTFAAAVATGFYKNPVALAAALQTAMNATATSAAPTVTYSSTTGMFTFKATGTLLTIKWNTGANTANSVATKVGFLTSGDSSGTGAATGYTGTASNLASPYTATLDSSQPIAAKNQEVMIGDATDYTCFDASDVSYDIGLTRTETKSVCAATGVSGSTYTGRTAKVMVKALLQQYDVAKFDRFINNTLTKFQWSFGNKVAGNWTPGQCGYAYVPAFSITKFQITAANNLAVLEMEGEAAVDSSGNGEAYLGFL